MNALTQRYRVEADPLRSERRAEAVMVGAGLLMLLLLVWSAFRALMPGSQQPVVPSADSMQVAALSGNALATLEDREEIRTRPLFWASRSPLGVQEALAQAEASEKVDKSTAAKPLKGIKLAGVFGGGDSGGIIVIRKGKKHRLMVGQDIEGWTVDSVAPTEAVLTNAGSETTLALQRGKPVANPLNEETDAGGGPDSAATEAGNSGAGETAAAGKAKTGKKKQNAAQKPARPDSLSLGGGDRSK